VSGGWGGGRGKLFEGSSTLWQNCRGKGGGDRSVQGVLKTEGRLKGRKTTMGGPWSIVHRKTKKKKKTEGLNLQGGR